MRGKYPTKGISKRLAKKAEKKYKELTADKEDLAEAKDIIKELRIKNLKKLSDESKKVAWKERMKDDFEDKVKRSPASERDAAERGHLTEADLDLYKKRKRKK